MKELKIPELIENTDLPKSISQKEFEQMLEDNWEELVPDPSFGIEGLNLHIDLDGNDVSNYLYAYISCEGAADYYDYAIVKTDDFYFKTYADYKKAVKEMSEQLIERWRTWVDGLYQIGE